MSASANACHVDILVIGAGPVGLASAIQLGRAQIKTVVAERRTSFSRHPKAFGIHARTMEIFRQWGIAEELRAAGGMGNEPFRSGWMTRLAGIEFGSITIGESQEEIERLLSWSPEVNCACGQDLVEPILAREASRHASVELRLGCEVTSVAQDVDGVTAELRDASTGTLSTLRARYVIGADGVRSRTRGWAGLTETAEPDFGNSINVRFHADLDTYRAGRRYILFWIINSETQGAFLWSPRGDEWIYNFEAQPGEDPQIYTNERCAEVVKAAIGAPEVEVKIDSILHWQHNQAVADHWRSRRLFIAGDAAHRFPPHGGFGMNSGIQDSVNLVWKLQAVLRWGAGDALLDTYEGERRPVAQANANQCVLNTRRMAETGWLVSDPSALAAIERAEGQALRDRIAGAIPAQREQFLSQGQQFGYIYTSGAVIDDGTEAELSTVSDYRPTGQPGARAPHAWLIDKNGTELSTIDLYDGKSFVLLAGADGAAWMDAVNTACTTGVPVRGFVIGSEGLRERPATLKWAELAGVSGSGAILIRPDGHVGMRERSLADAPARRLANSLKRILSRRIDV